MISTGKLMLYAIACTMTAVYAQDYTDNMMEMEKSIWNNKALEEKQEEDKAKHDELYESMARLILEEEKEQEFGKCEKELVSENAEIDAEYDKAFSNNETATVSDNQSRKLFGLSTADLEKTAGDVAAAKAAVSKSTSSSDILSIIQSFKAW